MFATPFRRFASRDNTHVPEELRRDRAQNDQKLKSKYERIFEKYERNFEGVGDEIDIVTGQVIVDNGHLARMQHERDTGSSPSRRFLRAFTQELGGEDHQESRAIGRMRAQSRALHTPRSSQSHQHMQSHTARQHRESRELAAATPTRQPSHSVLNNAQSALIPMMRATGAAAGVNPDAIQSLGTALATQIATFLNQQLMSQLGGLQSSNPWQVPALPTNPSRESIALRSPSPNPGLSLWATEDEAYHGYSPPPHRPRRGRTNRTRRDSDTAMESVEFSNSGYTHEEHDADLTWEEPLPTLEALKFEGFLSQANYNFQTLALGFANRATLSEKEERRGKKRREQAEAHAWAQQDDSGNIARRGMRGNPFTIDEDRLIVRLKRQNLSALQISRYLPGRSVTSIAVRYARALKPGSERWKGNRVIELADDYDENADNTSAQPIVKLGPEGLEANTSGHFDTIRETANRKRRRYDSEETILNEDADETDPENIDPVQPVVVRKKRGRPRKHPRPDDGLFLAAVSGQEVLRDGTLTTNDKKKRKTKRQDGFVNFDASSFGAYDAMDTDEQQEDAPVQEQGKKRPGQANVIFRQDPFIYVEPRKRSALGQPSAMTSLNDDEHEAPQTASHTHGTIDLTLPPLSTVTGSRLNAVPSRKSHQYEFPLDPQLMEEMDVAVPLDASDTPQVVVDQVDAAVAVEQTHDSELEMEQENLPVDDAVPPAKETAAVSPLPKPTPTQGSVNNPIPLEAGPTPSDNRPREVSYIQPSKSPERSSPAAASPHYARPLHKVTKGKLLPTTPINRTPLRSSKVKSDADRSSLRTSMLRHQFSSPHGQEEHPWDQ